MTQTWSLLEILAMIVIPGVATYWAIRGAGYLREAKGSRREP